MSDRRPAAQAPEAMTYIRLDGYGPPENLRPDTMPVPTPAEGELLIRVAAAGVNRPDVLQRLGNYNPPPGASPVLGLEAAGTVVACGPGTRRFAVGDAVCALTPGGGYAEYVVVPEPQCLPVPKGLSLLEAAALPETFFTVWANMFGHGRLRPGEWVLVHGGTSGIGTTAIQLAKAFGAHAIATAGSEEKCRACLDLGADHAVNYRARPFEEAVLELTGGRGVDVILDIIGGSYVPRNLKALAMDGRLVQIAYLESSTVHADFLTLMTRRLTWTGSTMRPRTVAEKGAIAGDLEREVWPLIESGRVRPRIHATFPLAEAAAAHRLMESSAHIGKIMLEVAP